MLLQQLQRGLRCGGGGGGGGGAWCRGRLGDDGAQQGATRGGGGGQACVGGTAPGGAWCSARGVGGPQRGALPHKRAQQRRLARAARAKHKALQRGARRQLAAVPLLHAPPRAAYQQLVAAWPAATRDGSGTVRAARAQVQQVRVRGARVHERAEPPLGQEGLQPVRRAVHAGHQQPRPRLALPHGRGYGGEHGVQLLPADQAVAVVVVRGEGARQELGRRV
mmetsp:Transcript_23341/g.59737  ORF Transcript_23341/g.59737 Transcript_23341/m.59737 type:complete len:222 (+) Transcript_23341:1436-2101(+)